MRLQIAIRYWMRNTLVTTHNQQCTVSASNSLSASLSLSFFLLPLPFRMPEANYKLHSSHLFAPSVSISATKRHGKFQKQRWLRNETLNFSLFKVSPFRSLAFFFSLTYYIYIYLTRTRIQFSTGLSAMHFTKVSRGSFT